MREAAPAERAPVRDTVPGDEPGNEEQHEAGHEPWPARFGSRRVEVAPAPMTPRTWRPEDPGTVAFTLDTLVAEVHFRADAPPGAVGHKALAVNLSDLAAMGASPRWAFVHAARPDPSPDWEEAFAAGLEGLAARFGVRVERGRIREGPLVVAIEAAGTFPDPRPPLRRSGAQPGDAVYVTGTLGDAAGALEGAGALAERLDFPEPRVAAGLALRGIATSAIDVSDGLCADLGHVLRASGCGASLETARLPLSEALVAAFGRERATDLALAGGDDYELGFTVAPEREPLLAAAPLDVPVTRIGVVERTPGLRCVEPDGRPRPVPAGYEHFAPGKPPPSSDHSLHR